MLQRFADQHFGKIEAVQRKIDHGAAASGIGIGAPVVGAVVARWPPCRIDPAGISDADGGDGADRIIGKGLAYCLVRRVMPLGTSAGGVPGAGFVHQFGSRAWEGSL